ncbi:molybdopterin cofactor-binding domain-containing protein [Ramlibacter sp. WS9]|uniref:xanthine dehydrogenase family protein molybdopterin-binding subunit n=1 Tax=Ramlibacter sp. WS9 TaxID=1882741 RepID=UPI0011447497|nr:molybdopterin cofactor-binding domain-containing protein [Ramlibacter sp. WS9]ROZ74355.1 xanthine dehydrogenase family protein molybdopterin-binding subunit [Ramlibacter sp. WS9]
MLTTTPVDAAQSLPSGEPRLTRRRFTLAASGAVLTVAIPLGAQTPPPAARPPVVHAPGSFIRIAADGLVTFLLPTSEMGQGIHTAQAMILAEELGADWTRVRTTMPEQVAPDYRLPTGQQASFGSYGVRFWHDPLRRAAAQMRELLTLAAAERWLVPPASLMAEDGHIAHAATGRRIQFGALVQAASALPVPQNPVLRPVEQRKLTGKTMRRVDTPDKVTGRALYAVDMKAPGMLHGAVRLSPVFRAEVESMDAASVRAMPGVVAVVPVPGGAVVVARSWWQAKQAADKLTIQFKATPNDRASTPELDDLMRAALDGGAVPPALQRGDVDAAFRAPHKLVEADYAVPLLAHVCMEPINCMAQAGADRLDLWTGTQGQDNLLRDCGKAGGYKPEQVFFHNAYLGGGFGRKTQSDAAVQATLASRAVGGLPVKVLWSRADDIQQGRYRQTMMCRMRAALDADGRILGLRVRVAGPQMGREFGIPLINGVADPWSVGGIVDMQYQIPNLLVEHAVVPVPMPLSPWRSIANSFTGFFVEAFINECATAAGKDPLEFRRQHLQGRPRMLAVLDRVAQSAGWGSPAPAGVARGLAVVESYGSPVAQIVEARLRDGRIKVEKVHVAINCGRAINPGQIEAQMSGGVVDAMSVALRAKVTIKDGRTEQSSFGDYQILRMGEEPQVITSIVEIGSPLGGVGEPGVPPLAPALAAAASALSGRPVRRLPLADLGLA